MNSQTFWRASFFLDEVSCRPLSETWLDQG